MINRCELICVICKENEFKKTTRVRYVIHIDKKKKWSPNGTLWYTSSEISYRWFRIITSHPRNRLCSTAYAANINEIIKVPYYRPFRMGIHQITWTPALWEGNTPVTTRGHRWIPLSKDQWCESVSMTWREFKWGEMGTKYLRTKW